MSIKSNKRKLEMIRLIEEGKTFQEIGAIYGGISRQRVGQIVGGVSKKTNKISDEFRKFFQQIEIERRELREKEKLIKKENKVRQKILNFQNNILPDENGCWIWQGYKHLKLGYGVVNIACVAGKERYTHRVAWILKHGEIPKGMFVLHKCDNPACINWHHLYLGTQKDNIRDREERFNHSPWKGRNKETTPRRVAHW